MFFLSQQENLKIVVVAQKGFIEVVAKCFLAHRAHKQQLKQPRHWKGLYLFFPNNLWAWFGALECHCLRFVPLVHSPEHLSHVEHVTDCRNLNIASLIKCNK